MNAASFGFLRVRAPNRMAEILDFRIAYSLRSEIRKKIFYKISSRALAASEIRKKFRALRSALLQTDNVGIAKFFANAFFAATAAQIALDGAIRSLFGPPHRLDRKVSVPRRERAPGWTGRWRPFKNRPKFERLPALVGRSE